MGFRPFPSVKVQRNARFFTETPKLSQQFPKPYTTPHNLIIMPLIRTKFTHKEQRITSAIKALDLGKSKKVADAHHTYNVPYNEL